MKNNFSYWNEMNGLSLMKGNIREAIFCIIFDCNKLGLVRRMQKISEKIRAIIVLTLIS